MSQPPASFDAPEARPAAPDDPAWTPPSRSPAALADPADPADPAAPAHLAARPRRRLGPVAAGAGLAAVTAGLLAISPVVPDEDVPGQALYACRAEVDRRAPALDDEHWLVEVIDDESYGYWVTGFLGPAGWSCAASHDGGSWDVDVTVEAPDGVRLTPPPT